MKCNKKLHVILLLIVLTSCSGSGDHSSSSGGNGNSITQCNISQTNDLPVNPPVNPNASADAVAILNYLYGLTSQTEKRILSGQVIDNGRTPIAWQYDKYINDIVNKTGEYPALLSVNYSYGEVPDLTEVNTAIAEHWNSGGLVSINFTTTNPFTLVPAFDNTVTDYDLLFQAGSAEQNKWFSDLDKIAEGLSALQDQGVVVILHPLYEMNGGWSWWGSNSGGTWTTQAQFIALWRQLYDYFTDTKGLNNLLWLYGPNFIETSWQPGWGAQDVDYYYPGDDYVDITGLSYYKDHMNALSDRDNYTRMVNLGKPFGLIEIGPDKVIDGSFDNMMVIDAIRNEYPAITFFSYWTNWDEKDGTERQMCLSCNARANEMLSHACVANRDDVNAVLNP